MKAIITPDWIFGSEADEAIVSARTRLDAGDGRLQIAEGLRKRWPAEAATAALEQALLQRAAREKFRLADQFRFHRKGLEQATSEAVARYKASLIPAGANVCDACCGIGGDLLALAARHRVRGVDADPFTVRCAVHNLRVAGFPETEVLPGRVPDFDSSGSDWIHIDPDRRKSGKRTSRLEQSDPPWPVLRKWIGARPALVKLAPAASFDDAEIPEVHRQWIGWRRECREQLAIVNVGDFLPGRRSAVSIGSDGSVAVVEGVPTNAPALGRLLARGDLLIEPHAAVYAAGLVGRLAEQLGACQLSQASPYLVGPAEQAIGVAQTFEVIEAGSLDQRLFRQALAASNAGQIEWKQRGVPVADFGKWSRTTAPSESVTVILYRESASLRFAICRRRRAEFV
jgi:hypothetical protein